VPEAIAWIDPQPARPQGTEGGPLSPEDQASWQDAGYALVDGILPEECLDPVLHLIQRELRNLSAEEQAAVSDFGSDGRMVFPTGHEALDALSLHPRVLAAVAQLLETPIHNLRLTQADLWSKFGRSDSQNGRYDNTDQRIHVDYPNHTLTHPPAWETPDAVEIIVYFDAVEDCGGATAVIPREGPEDPAYAWPMMATPGLGTLPWINDRESAERDLAHRAPEIHDFRAEHLYPRQRRARFGPGSLLFYRHDTWHRGTPLLPGKQRVVQNLTFRKAESEWISTLHPGWAWKMYRRDLSVESLIARASVDQRCVLGFPAPGHPYWTSATVSAVEARYGALGMDISPYRRALSKA
jgi:hypothetical protein